MRFKLDELFITCIPDDPTEILNKKDSLGNNIKLINYTLHFSNIVKLPHPDILALICFIAFFPFLSSSQRIIFPLNVSPIWLDILKDHHLTTNTNINTNQPPYIGKYNNIALSWGGGMDTWALYKLQPHIYTVLIHEYQDFSPLPLQKQNYPNIEIVKTNLRDLIHSIDNKNPEKTTSAGWFIWVAVLISSLWLSNEYSLSLLTVGGNIGSVYLNDGTKYHPTHLKPNLWLRTFAKLGLPIYVPLSGLTDLGILKIVGLDMSLVKYCWYSDKDGNNCHKCKKCIRKEFLMGNNNVKDYFNGPSYEYVRTKNKNLAKWVYKYYQPALDLISRDDLKQDLIIQLNKFDIEFIPSELEYLVEHYGWTLN